MATQIRITDAQGNVRVVNADGKGNVDVKPGEKVEVVGGKVAGTQTQGGALVIKTADGQTVKLNGFSSAMGSSNPPSLVIPGQVAVKVQDADGTVRLKVMEPGGKLDAPAGAKVTLLGADPGLGATQQGNDLVLSDANGNSFTLGNTSSVAVSSQATAMTSATVTSTSSPLTDLPLTRTEASGQTTLQGSTNAFDAQGIATPIGAQLVVPAASASPAAPGAPATTVAMNAVLPGAPDTASNPTATPVTTATRPDATPTPPAATGPGPSTPDVPTTRPDAATPPADTPPAATPPATTPVVTPTAETGAKDKVVAVTPVVQGLQAPVADLTAEPRPTIYGTAGAGVNVTVYLGDKAIGTVVADAQGKWSLTPAEDLGAGKQLLKATADGATSAAFAVTIDLASPAPTVLGFKDAAGAAVQSIAAAKPTVVGTGVPGGKVELSIDGAAPVTVDVGTDGKWAHTPAAGLAAGNHVFSAVAVGPTGKVSATSTAIALGVQATGVAAVSPEVKLTPDSGLMYANATPVNSVQQPVFKGKAIANATVPIFLDGIKVGSTVSGDDGNWTFKLGEATLLRDGNHTLTTDTSHAFVFKHAVVGAGGPSIGEVKTTASGADTVISLKADAINWGGANAPVVTIDDMPVATGVVGTPRLVNDALVTTFSASAKVSSDGLHTVSVKGYDSAGNEKIVSRDVLVMADPEAPVIKGLAAGSRVNGTELMKGASGTVEGTGTPGSTIYFKVDGTVQPVTATVDDKGAWSATIVGGVRDIDHQLVAFVKTSGGDKASGAYEYATSGEVGDATIEVVAASAIPAGNNVVPMIVGPRPVLIGTALPGVSVKIFVDGVADGVAVADADGVWKYNVQEEMSLTNGKSDGVFNDQGRHDIDVVAYNAAINPSPGLASTRDRSNHVIVQTVPIGDSRLSEAAASTYVGDVPGVLATNMFTTIKRPGYFDVTNANFLFRQQDYEQPFYRNDKVNVAMAHGLVGTETVGRDAVSAYNNPAQGVGSLGGKFSYGAQPLQDGAYTFTFTSTVDLSFFDKLGLIFGSADNFAKFNELYWTNFFSAKPAVSFYNKLKDVASVVTYCADRAVSTTLTTAQESKDACIAEADKLKQPTQEGGSLYETAAQKATAFAYDKAKEAASNAIKQAAGKAAGGAFTAVTMWAEETLNITFQELAGGPPGSKPRTVFRQLIIGHDSFNNPRLTVNTNNAGEVQIFTRTNNNLTAAKTIAGAETTVDLLVDGFSVGRFNASSDGVVLHNLRVQNGSTHTYQTITTDPAGNQWVSPVTVFKQDSKVLDQLGALRFDGLAPESRGMGYEYANTRTPTFVGRGVPGALVELTIDGKRYDPDSGEYYDTKVGADGVWRYVKTTAMADGTSHAVAVTQHNPGINSAFYANSKAETFTFFVATGNGPAALAPALVGGVSGVTGLARPTVSGQVADTTSLGATKRVQIYVDGVLDSTAEVGADGKWSARLAKPLADGYHDVTVKNVSKFDAVSDAGPALKITTSTQVATPVVAGLLTNAPLPTITGTAPAWTKVTVYVDGQAIGTVKGGAWKIEVPATIAEGAHTITAVAKDEAGVSSARSAAVPLVVETSLRAPTVQMAAASDTSLVQEGLLTKLGKPTLVGTAKPDSQLVVTIDGQMAGTAKADGHGVWSYTPGTALANGKHAAVVTAIDPAGTTSAPATFAFTVDAAAPAAARVFGIVAIASLDGGADRDFAVQGTAAPGASVHVVATIAGKAADLGSVTANAAGRWSLPLYEKPALDVASIKLAVDVTSAAGVAGTAAASTVSFGAGAIVTGFETPVPSGATNVVRPVLVGKGPANKALTVTLDGADLPGTVTTDAQGTWRLVAPSALAEGFHTVAVVEGGRSSATWVFKVDTTPPVVSVTGFSDPTDTGFGQGDGITGAVNPTIVGKSEPGATVSVLVDGVAVGTTVTDGDGRWGLALTSSLPAGPRVVTATAIDAAGNVGVAGSAAVVGVVQSAVPGKPVVTGLSDATDTGVSRTDGITKIGSPTLEGTAAPGAIVSVKVDGVAMGATQADAAGNWALPVSARLAAGSHGVTAVATNMAGQSGATSDAYTFQVVAATLGTAVITAAAKVGENVVVDGTAAVGARVALTMDGVPTATTTADAQGKWSIALPGTIVVKDHAFASMVFDVAGNNGALTPWGQNPTRVDGPTTTSDPMLGEDGAYHTGALVLQGTGPAGRTITIFDGNVPIGTTKSNASGAWTFSPAAPLSIGGHALSAAATDAQGNVVQGTERAVEIPAAWMTQVPAIATSEFSFGSSRGPGGGTSFRNGKVSIFVDGIYFATVDADLSGSWAFGDYAGITNGLHTIRLEHLSPSGQTATTTTYGSFSDAYLMSIQGVVDGARGGADRFTLKTGATPQFVGTLAPGLVGRVTEVRVDGQAYGKVRVVSTGHKGAQWELDAPGAALAPGSHTVQIGDFASGNVNEVVTYNLVVAAPSTPAAPVLTWPAPGGAEAVANGRPTIAGTADPGTFVRVWVDGAYAADATVGDDGAWSVRIDAPLGAGAHAVYAKAFAAPGEAFGPASTEVPFAVLPGLVAPVATGTEPVAAIPPTDGTLLAPVDNPTIVGTAQPGTTMRISVDGRPMGLATADGGGKWKFALPVHLIEGAHHVTITAFDAEGRESAPATVAMTVDVVGGDTALGGVAYTSVWTEVGTADAGALVNILIDGQVVGSTRADAAGKWSYDVSPYIGDTPHAIAATAVSASGAVTVARSHSISTSAILKIDGLTADTDSGRSHADGVTSDNTPTFVGTALPNAAVQVVVNGVVVASTTSDAAGVWKVAAATAIPDGVHTATVSTTDASGNFVVSQAGLPLTIDTVAAGKPVVAGLRVAAGVQSIEGTGEAGTSIEVFVNGASVGKADADGQGKWSKALATPITEVAADVYAVGTDLAGTTGASATAKSLANFATGQGPTGLINETRPTVAGTAVPGAAVAVFLDGVEVARPVADADGAWSHTFAARLPDGPRAVAVAPIDGGLAATKVAAASFTVDATPPPLSFGIAGTPDVGSTPTAIRSHKETNSFTGVTEADRPVELFQDGQLKATTTAGADGTYTFKDLKIGDGSYSAETTDLAGNRTKFGFGLDIRLAAATPDIGLANAAGDNGHTFLTYAATPTLVGAADPLATVTYKLDGGAPVVLQADDAGEFSLTLPALTPGRHTITSSAVDVFGQPSYEDGVFAFDYATTGPALSYGFTVVNGFVTNGSFSPEIAAPAGAVVTSFVETLPNGDTKNIQVFRQSSGTYTSATSILLNGAGTHVFKVGYEDAAGHRILGDALEVNLLNSVGIPTLTAVGAYRPSTGGVFVNTATPAFTGTADPGATVRFKVDGVELPAPYDTVADPVTGAFSFVLPAHAAGPIEVVAVATNAAGISRASNAQSLAIQLASTAPPLDAPRMITTGLETVDGVYYAGAGDQFIGGDSPRFSSKIQVFDGDVKIGDNINISGTYSFRLPAAMAPGLHLITVREIDQGGFTNQASAPLKVFIDPTPPAPTVTGLTDGTDTGAADNVTTSTTLTFTGTGIPGRGVDLLVDNLVKATTTADAATGAWTMTVTGVAPGAHEIKAQATSLAHVVGRSAVFGVTVDLTPPGAPILTGVAPFKNLLVGSAKPTFTGTAEAKGTVEIAIDDVVQGTAPVVGTGWSFTPAAGIADGLHTVTIRAIDAAGNRGLAVATQTINVDGTAPAASAAPTLAAASDSGLAGDGKTNKTAVTVSGTGEANATVTLAVDGVDVPGSVSTGGGTIWTFTGVPLPATDGPHRIEAVVEDAFGRSSAASEPLVVTYDGTAPDAPPAPALAAGSDTGLDATDRLVNLATPVLTGTAEAGATVTIYKGGTVMGTGKADGPGGAWTITPTTALAPGDNALTVKATDAAGNQSPDSATLTVKLDTTGPGLVLGAFEDPTGRQATQALSGTAKAGSLVELKLDGGSYGAGVVATDGTWRITFPQPAIGGHTVTVRATDAAGTVAAPIDKALTIVPAGAPTIDGTAAGPTNVATRTFTGTANSGDTVTLYEGDDVRGSIVAAGGTWSITPAVFGHGDHVLTARATTPSGLESGASNAFTFKVDTVRPDAPTDVHLADATGASAANAVAGTAEKGATIKATLNGTDLPETTASAADGTWSIPIAGSALRLDGNTVSVVATDAAGNASPSTGALAFTIAPPVTPTVSAPTHGPTRTMGPVLSGTGPAGSTIEIYDGTSKIATTAVLAGGTWTKTLDLLGHGAHSFTVVAKDAAGHLSATSDAWAYDVDVQGPAGPTGIGFKHAATEANNAIVGTTEAGASLVRLKIDGGGYVSATVNPDGTWFYDLPGGTLPVGSHTVVAQAADALGTVGDESSTVTLVVAPVAQPTIDALADAGPTSVPQVTLAGGATTGTIVTVYEGASPVGQTTAVDGRWEVTVTGLGTATHTLKARAETPAGHQSTYSSTVDYTVDVTPPNAPVIAGPATVPASALTKPTIAGTAEKNATITIYVDGDEKGTAHTSASSTSWSYTFTDDLANGSRLITAKATDAVGNVSAAASNVITYVVDLTGPTDLTAQVDGGPPTGPMPYEPIFRGTIEPGGKVEIYLDSLSGTPFDTVTDLSNGGTWMYQFGIGAYPQGDHTVYFRAVDKFGNVGSSTSLAYAFDSIKPDAPAVDQADDAAATDPLPTFTGTAEDGSLVTLTYGSVTFEAVTGPDGKWSATPAATLADAPYLFTVRAKDAAGNESAGADYVSYVLKRVTPAAALAAGDDRTGGVGDLRATAKADPTFAGTGVRADETVVFKVDDGAEQTATAGTGGAFSFEPTLTDGQHTISYRTTYGSKGSADWKTLVVDVDANAPTLAAGTSVAVKPTRTVVLDADQLVVADGARTLAGVVLEVTAMDASRGVFKNGATALAVGATFAAQDLQDGKITFTGNAELGGGSLTVQATDAAGHASGTATMTVTADLTPPAIRIKGEPVITDTAANTVYVDETYLELDAGNGSPDGATFTVAGIANADGYFWIDADHDGSVNGAETQLAAGGTFTWADVDAGLLAYHRAGISAVPVELTVSATDAYGLDAPESKTLTVYPERPLAVTVENGKASVAGGFVTTDGRPEFRFTGGTEGDQLKVKITIGHDTYDATAYWPYQDPMVPYDRFNFYTDFANLVFDAEGKIAFELDLTSAGVAQSGTETRRISYETYRGGSLVATGTFDVDYDTLWPNVDANGDRPLAQHGATVTIPTSQFHFNSYERSPKGLFFTVTGTPDGDFWYDETPATSDDFQASKRLEAGDVFTRQDLIDGKIKFTNSQDEDGPYAIGELYVSIKDEADHDGGTLVIQVDGPEPPPPPFDPNDDPMYWYRVDAPSADVALLERVMGGEFVAASVPAASGFHPATVTAEGLPDYGRAMPSVATLDSYSELLALSHVTRF